MPTLPERSRVAANALPAGWLAHYATGIGFALAFVLLMPEWWLERPTLLPPLCFGVATVVVPFFTLQSAWGMGVAAWRSRSPWRVRLKSTGTHTVFGVGLYAGAQLFGVL